MGIEVRSTIVGYVVTSVENNSSLKIFFTMANNNKTSITESEIMSEGIHSTPIPTKRVEKNDVIKMMRLLLDEKFNEQNIKFDVKFDEVNKEIQRQNVNDDKRINEIEIHCDNIQKQTETINEQFHTKISNLDDKINQINETVQNQIETQHRDRE